MSGYRAGCHRQPMILATRSCFAQEYITNTQRDCSDTPAINSRFHYSLSTSYRGSHVVLGIGLLRDSGAHSTPASALHTHQHLRMRASQSRRFRWAFPYCSSWIQTRGASLGNALFRRHVSIPKSPRSQKASGNIRSFSSSRPKHFMLDADSTIYALSTAPGRAAIAVVRVSGPACISV